MKRLNWLIIPLFLSVTVGLSGCRNPFFPTQPTDAQDSSLNYTDTINNLPLAKTTAPKSLLVNGVDLLLKESVAKMVTKNQPWCSIETDLQGCWLSKSNINLVLGFTPQSQEKYFNQVLPDQLLEVNFGYKKVLYNVVSIAEVPFTETLKLMQTEPALTIVFFDTDEKGKSAGNKSRTIITAVPVRDPNQVVLVTDTELPLPADKYVTINFHAYYDVNGNKNPDFGENIQNLIIYLNDTPTNKVYNVLTTNEVGSATINVPSNHLKRLSYVIPELEVNKKLGSESDLYIKVAPLIDLRVLP